MTPEVPVSCLTVFYAIWSNQFTERWVYNHIQVLQTLTQGKVGYVPAEATDLGDVGSDKSLRLSELELVPSFSYG